ncbi:hypothetical protein FUAX_27330 [Fulvitalea axinellae]|uniref:PA14 domain-containing protein n=1 Tax=Fulvitalea axinellae TaxID=1182444 RepID=A0AAU9DB49_9BACT|nr:hypothetical protein FUAX_27330 [Fulvitalea axinellae]
MKKIILPVLGLCLAMLASCTRQASTRRADHVVLIGIDGLSVAGVRNAETPVLDSLMNAGAYTLRARAVLPTVSSPNWASMVTGVDVAQHGVMDNDWERAEMRIAPVSAGEEGMFPSVFYEIRRALPNAKIGAIYDWGGFGRLIEDSIPDLKISPKGVEKTVAEAIRFIKAERPDFTFIQLDHVDHAGHSKGHETEAYYQAVEEADRFVARILKALAEAKMAQSTTVIITSDHGGIGYGHGGFTEKEINIPVILAGPGVKKGYRIAAPVYQFDAAANVLFALGVERPESWLGKPTAIAYVDGPSVKTAGFMDRIPAPEILPADSAAFSGYGFLSENDSVTVRFKAQKGAKVYYTLDGSLPTQSSKLYTGPFVLDSTAVVKAKAFAGFSQQSNVATSSIRVVKNREGHGLRYAYYESNAWTDTFPDLAKEKPVAKGQSLELRVGNIDRRTQKGEKQMALTFDGYFLAKQKGKYKFATRSDQGAKLWIDGKLVTGNKDGNGIREERGDIKLDSGRHRLRLAYFDTVGNRWLDVMVKGPNLPEQVVPADLLFLEAE